MNAACQASMFNGQLCGQALEHEGGCIFHAEDKEIDAFRKSLNAYVEQHREEMLLDFSGFIFPEGLVAKDFMLFKKFVDEKDLIFDGAVFKGVAYFWNAEFKGGVFFNGAKFERGAEFQRARFKTVDFTSAEFIGDVSFRKAEFGVEVTEQTTIQEESLGLTPITFASAEFYGKADFTFAQFYKNYCFESVFVHSHANILFHDVDLSKGTFLRTNISENFHFINEEWSNIHGRTVVYDEILAREDKSSSNFSQIAVLYRQLRILYEKRLAYAEAGNFQLGEMEMRLLAALAKENKFLKFIPKNIDYYLLPFYKWFSDYGERSFRPLLWLVFTWVAFAATYHGIGFDSPFKDFKYAILYSFMAMIFVPTKNIVANVIKDYLWLVRLEQILTIVFATLLIFSIRRATKR